MKRKSIIIILLLCGLCFALERTQPFNIDGVVVDPGQLHTVKDTWVILDETTSADTEPSNLAVTVRTYQLVKAAISTAASGDDEISVFDVPRSWNGIRFRAIGITDGGTATYQIYAGTLGDGNLDSGSTSEDCDLAYIGQFAFTVGTQSSIYHQTAFTSGGTRTPVAGETVTGATSGETAVIISITISSGTFAGGDAAGTLLVRTASGAFQSEDLDLTTLAGTSILNVMNIGADLFTFELADTLTVTSSDWTRDITSTSPTGNRVAEALVDLAGADVLVLVGSVVTADCKLLGKGF